MKIAAVSSRVEDFGTTRPRRARQPGSPSQRANGLTTHHYGHVGKAAVSVTVTNVVPSGLE